MKGSGTNDGGKEMIELSREAMGGQKVKRKKRGLPRAMVTRRRAKKEKPKNEEKKRRERGQRRRSKRKRKKGGEIKEEPSKWQGQWL